MREMILAENEDDRRAALAKLLPLQRDDFDGIFKAMDGPPGHHPAPSIRRCTSSCPHDEPGVARAGPAPPARTRRGGRTRASQSCTESNPMLGHRGCRLGITYPEITEMQARAIFEAACDLAERGRERRTRRS